MKKHLIALIGVSAAMLLVAGCGTKGPLEPPPGETEAPQVDKTVEPMGSPAVTPKWPGAASSTTGAPQ